MNLRGSHRFGAPRAVVFDAIRDPAVLLSVIPGCEELKSLSPTELEAAAKAKIGPVSARFKGKVVLSNLNPPESYTLTGEGTGGAAGFAKGEAQVTLVPEGNQTILRYAVDGLRHVFVAGADLTSSALLWNLLVLALFAGVFATLASLVIRREVA